MNVSGVCYGQSDVPTAIEDEVAASAVLERLGAAAASGVERLWTSPWKRTRGVAEAVGARLGVAVEIDPRLSELSFGEWEGRRYAALEAEDPDRFAAWMADWQHAAPPGGERVADLVARVRAWREDARGKGGLAIAHAGTIRALRAMGRGCAYAEVVNERVAWLEPERVA